MQCSHIKLGPARLINGTALLFMEVRRREKEGRREKEMGEERRGRGGG